MELSNNKRKYIRSVSRKKIRDKEGVFIAEGDKAVCSLLPYFRSKMIIASKDWLDLHDHFSADEIFVTSLTDLSSISTLSSPPPVISVFYKKTNISPNFSNKELLLGLDCIQDPGNLGTIIRIADWFGIKNVFCSNDTVDVYNTKTIQATMGALARVNVHYVDLKQLILTLHEKKWPIYGTLLDGDSLYESSLSDFGLILMGNEGNGLSTEIRSLLSNKILIPNYPPNSISSESLNVAAATAIICSEFRRRLSSPK